MTIPMMAIAAMFIAAGASVAAIDTMQIHGGPASSMMFGVSVPIAKIKKITVNPYTIIIDTGDAAITRPIGGGNGPVRVHFISSSPAIRDIPRVGKISEDLRARKHASWVNVVFSTVSPGDARVTVYNSDGKIVRELLAGFCAAGRHELVWDGAALSGQPAAPGVYFIVGTFNRRAPVRQTVMLE